MTKGKRHSDSERAVDRVDETMDKYLATLLELAEMESVKRRLRVLHGACRELTVRERTLTAVLVAKTCDKLSDESIGVSTIRNKRSGKNLYNRLFVKWRSVVAEKNLPTRKLSVADFDVTSYIEGRLDYISDMSLRHHVVLLLANNRSLAQQLNILRVNLADAPIRVEASDAPVTSFKAHLSQGEIAALQNAIEARSMKARGMKAMVDGSIVLKDGRVIFDPGFVSAISKLVGDFIEAE